MPNSPCYWYGLPQPGTCSFTVLPGRILPGIVNILKGTFKCKSRVKGWIKVYPVTLMSLVPPSNRAITFRVFVGFNTKNNGLTTSWSDWKWKSFTTPLIPRLYLSQSLITLSTGSFRPITRIAASLKIIAEVSVLWSREKSRPSTTPTPSVSYRLTEGRKLFYKAGHPNRGSFIKFLKGTKICSIPAFHNVIIFLIRNIGVA